jgi:hypothetical protein
MDHSFTLASLFMIFVPMPLLIIFSLISLFNEIKREKKLLMNAGNEKVSIEKSGL